MALETRNVFVDTSIFESENFLEGNKLHQLINLGKNGYLNLMITRITYNEIINRGIKKIGEGKAILKKLNQDGRMLRNIEFYRPLFNKFLDEEVKKEFVGKIDDLIRLGNITILDYAQMNIEDIFELYFQNLPPFSEGQKKHEFPDAFSLKTVVMWCIENKSVCYCISHDKDMKGNFSDRLIIVNDFVGFLDKTTREYETHSKHKERLSKIEMLYEEYYEEIKEEIKSELKYKIQNDLQYSYSNGRSVDVDDVEIEDFQILKYFILNIDEHDAKIELELVVKFSAEIIYDNYDTASYDKEDDRWLFVETIEEKIKEKVFIPVTIIINHEPLAGSEYASFRIESINNDNDIKI